MFAAFALSLAIGAPVPPATPPIPAGAAPRVLEIKADAEGKVTIRIQRTEMRKLQVAVAGGPGGAALPAAGGVAPAMREVPVNRIVDVEVHELKDLSITTADGKQVDKDDAMKKLAAGAIVVVSSDGKPVSPVFLKVFKDDTLVLSSPELVAPQGPATPGRVGTTAVFPNAVPIAPIPGQAAPAVPLQPALPAVPAQPGPAAPPPVAKPPAATPPPPVGK